eukprot:403343670
MLDGKEFELRFEMKYIEYEGRCNSIYKDQNLRIKANHVTYHLNELLVNIYNIKGNQIEEIESQDFFIEENDIKLYQYTGTFSERHSRCFMMPVKKLRIEYNTQQKKILEVNLKIPKENPKLEELRIQYSVGNYQKDHKQVVYIGADLAILNLIRLEIQTTKQMPIFKTKDDFQFKRLRELVLMERAQQTGSTDIILSLIQRSFDTLETFEYIRSNDCLENLLKQEQAKEYVKLLQSLNKKKICNLTFLIGFAIQHHQHRPYEPEIEFEIYQEMGQFINLRSLRILYESNDVEEFNYLSKECLHNLNFLRRLHIDFMLQRSDFEQDIYNMLVEMIKIKEFKCNLKLKYELLHGFLAKRTESLFLISEKAFLTDENYSILVKQFPQHKLELSLIRSKSQQKSDGIDNINSN